jgi:hypothetical protein
MVNSRNMMKKTTGNHKPTALAVALRLVGLFAAVSLSAAESAPADRGQGHTAIGDAGHYFVHTPDLYANNPQGEAFTVTVHRHVWPADWANTGDCHASVQYPDGREVAAGTIPSGQEQVVLRVPAGAKGVYRIALQPAGSSLMWAECSLGQLVVACGPWDGDHEAKGVHERFYKNFNVHAMAPRRWYFHVPSGTRTFEVGTRILPFTSHREDYGFSVMSPRGQRVAAFFGGRSLRTELPPTGELRAQTIEVDEGCAGRFWSLWVVNGDSHTFSDLPLLLRGVPPYLAPTPEQWFNPATGQSPPKPVYDDSPVRLREKPGEPSQDKYLWTPATFLGDEDYNGWRGPQTLYLWNSENRPVDLGVGCYIADRAARFPVSYRVIAPAGTVALERDDTFGHGTSSRITIPPNGKGVYRIEIAAGHWFPWTEPATPIVIAGKPVPDGVRFELETGIARHWFFQVPRGTREFAVGVSVKNPDHVLHVEVHAPDRLMEVREVRGGSDARLEVPVPAGLDGKLWFLRTDIGSATRYPSGPGTPRHVRIAADIDLLGVPGYLAPTWEQWFHPVVTKGKSQETKP